MKLNYTFYIIILTIICTITPFHHTYGQGSRYTGNYKKSGQVTFTNQKNLVIEGLEINNVGGPAIQVHNCENVTIRYNRITNVGIKPAIYVLNSKNVTIVDNSLENVQSGLVAGTSQGIKFEYNDVLNVLGSLRGGSVIGVMAQFNNVSGAGNSISYNANENIPGQSSTEDIINIFNSNGTAQSPIVIRGNWIRGGGPSTSGGGINIGDYGGSYQITENNILVDPGQYGIGISGGNNMTMRNNKVFGKKNSFTNVGLTACNWYESVSKSHSIRVENNAINYTNKNGLVNTWWFYQNIEPVTGRETNYYDSKINASILPDQIIGRARSGLSPINPDDQTPGGGTTNPNNPDDENPGNGSVEKPGTPIPNLPKINNDPSITIYLDNYNRACINISGRQSSALVMIADSNGRLIHQQSLASYHTVLPNDPIPGTYYVYVKNGNKEHLKQLQIK